MKIIAVIGGKDSGKTTTTSYIIKRLSEDGFKVGGIKHIHHEFTMDTEGKDTWRMSKSGAKMVSSISPSEVAMLRRPRGLKKDLDTLLNAYEDEDIDIVVLEGFHSILKTSKKVLKIVTAKSVDQLGKWLDETSPPIIAASGIVAREKALIRKEIPVFDPVKDGEQLYAAVKKHIKGH